MPAFRQVLRLSGVITPLFHTLSDTLRDGFSFVNAFPSFILVNDSDVGLACRVFTLFKGYLAQSLVPINQLMAILHIILHHYFARLKAIGDVVLVPIALDKRFLNIAAPTPRTASNTRRRRRNRSRSSFRLASTAYFVKQLKKRAVVGVQDGQREKQYDDEESLREELRRTKEEKRILEADNENYKSHTEHLQRQLETATGSNRELVVDRDQLEAAYSEERRKRVEEGAEIETLREQVATLKKDLAVEKGGRAADRVTFKWEKELIAKEREAIKIERTNMAKQRAYHAQQEGVFKSRLGEAWDHASNAATEREVAQGQLAVTTANNDALRLENVRLQREVYKLREAKAQLTGGEKDAVRDGKEHKAMMDQLKSSFAARDCQAWANGVYAARSGVATANEGSPSNNAGNLDSTLPDVKNLRSLSPSVDVSDEALENDFETEGPQATSSPVRPTLHSLPTSRPVILQPPPRIPAPLPNITNRVPGLLNIPNTGTENATNSVPKKAKRPRRRRRHLRRQQLAQLAQYQENDDDDDGSDSDILDRHLPLPAPSLGGGGPLWCRPRGRV